MYINSKSCLNLNKIQFKSYVENTNIRKINDSIALLKIHPIFNKEHLFKFSISFIKLKSKQIKKINKYKSSNKKLYLNLYYVNNIISNFRFLSLQLLYNLNVNIKLKYKQLKTLQDLILRKINARWRRKKLKYLNNFKRKKLQFLNNFKKNCVSFLNKDIYLFLKRIKFKYNYFLKKNKQKLNLCFLKNIFFFKKTKIFNIFIKFRYWRHYNYFK